jgi:hypothetical protein
VQANLWAKGGKHAQCTRDLMCSLAPSNPGMTVPETSHSRPLNSDKHIVVTKNAWSQLSFTNLAKAAAGLSQYHYVHDCQITDLSSKNLHHLAVHARRFLDVNVSVCALKSRFLPRNSRFTVHRVPTHACSYPAVSGRGGLVYGISTLDASWTTTDEG